MLDDDDEVRGIRGQVVMGNYAAASQLFVEVKTPGEDGYQQKVSVSGDGTFIFNGSVNATYLLRVTDMSGNVLAEDLVSPNTMGSVEIQLKARTEASPVNGTVSAFELAH
jgi:hypothetical protein